MSNFQASRSMPLILSVLGMMVLAILLLYTEPALSESHRCENSSEDCSGLSFSDATSVMHFYEKDWLLRLGRFGAVAVIVAALGFTTRYWLAQALVIATGAAAMLAPAIWVVGHRDGFILGDGLIGFMACIFGMAIIPVVLYVGKVPTAQ